MSADGAGVRTRLSGWIPRWWAGEAGRSGALLSALLLPAELGYRMVMRLRNLAFDRGWRRIERIPLPVVSVGNLGVGGAGKTPFAAWLAGELERAGRRPAIALRGYGEDEVLLHRELNPTIPVFAAARRADAARAAWVAGCDVIILDDGFQHRALARDLDLVLVPAERWSAKQRLLPRGPWREPASALGRADAVVLTRKTASPARMAAARAEIQRLGGGIRVFEATLLPASLQGLHGSEADLGLLGDRSVLAVAALADPGSFAEHLRAVGARVELVSFPDHHPFTSAEAEALCRRAAGRPLVMTHKDAVKLRPLLPHDASAYVLMQRVEVREAAWLLDHVSRLEPQLVAP